MAGTNIYGELIRAQAQTSASDLSGPEVGLLYLNTTSHEMKWYANAAWRTAVDLSTAQVLTNKDYDGGTASNTSRITTPKNTTTNLNALTRKEGTLVYDTDTSQIKFDNGATLAALSTSATATPSTLGNVTSYFPVIASAVNTVSSADYTVLDTDGYEVILVTTAGANRTVTLPTASANAGRRLIIKKLDSGTGYVIVDGEGAETIDGATTKNLIYQYESMTLDCDGSNWHVIHYAETTKTQTVVLTYQSGWGAVTNENIKLARHGGWAHVFGYFFCGNVGATGAGLTLPTGLRVLYGTGGLATGASLEWVGAYVNHQTGATAVNAVGGALFVDGSDTEKIWFGFETSSNAFVKNDPNAFSNSNRNINIDFWIPIVDWQ